MTKESKGSTYRLYIGKLSRGVDEEDLKKRLSRYGQVEDLVLTRRDTEGERSNDYTETILTANIIAYEKLITPIDMYVFKFDRAIYRLCRFNSGWGFRSLDFTYGCHWSSKMCVIIV